MNNSNHLKRISAIDRYNNNPKYCKNCEIKIEVKQNQTPSETRKKSFCSQSCSCSYNNKGVKRTKNAEVYLCECGKPKKKLAKKCNKCYKSDISVADKPLSYFLKDGKYSTTKLTHLRKCAKETLEKSDKKKICIFCNDESLIPILQVCHIKGVMSFDKTATLREVNDLKNLAWMCPNHHALFDKGLITSVELHDVAIPLSREVSDGIVTHTDGNRT